MEENNPRFTQAAAWLSHKLDSLYKHDLNSLRNARIDGSRILFEAVSFECNVAFNQQKFATSAHKGERGQQQFETKAHKRAVKKKLRLRSVS